jgi:hypothetical protein
MRSGDQEGEHRSIVLPIVLALIGATATIVAAWLSRPGPDKPPLPSSDSLAGKFRIVGTNPNEGSYIGNLEISAINAPIYKLIWDAAKTPYIGVGIHENDILSVGWGNKGCGVAVYQVESNGTLNGKWASLMQNQIKMGTEIAVPLKSTTREMEYIVTGKTPDDLSYNDRLLIEKKGSLFALEWTNSKNYGVGILRGKYLAVGWGTEKNCNVVLYKVNPDRSLTGEWGLSDSALLGKEQAIRE